MKTLRIHHDAARGAPTRTPGRCTLLARDARCDDTRDRIRVGEFLVHSCAFEGSRLDRSSSRSYRRDRRQRGEHGVRSYREARQHLTWRRIAITSSMQVALFVAPVARDRVALTAPPPVAAFRPVEIATMALAAGLAWLVTKHGTSKRWEGFLLVGAYIGVVAVSTSSPKAEDGNAMLAVDPCALLSPCAVRRYRPHIIPPPRSPYLALWLHASFDPARDRSSSRCSRAAPPSPSSRPEWGRASELPVARADARRRAGRRVP